MRITIYGSARRHSIADAEVRTVINYPTITYPLQDHQAMFIGRPHPNEPFIEVAVDLLDPAEMIVFHAMMLRAKTVRDAGLEHLIDLEDLASQRPQLY